MKEFFKKAFRDMKEGAKAQHKVDKANLAAVKAESKAQWEEAKAMSKPEMLKVIMQKEREAQFAQAEERRKAAEAHTDFIKRGTKDL